MHADEAQNAKEPIAAQIDLSGQTLRINHAVYSLCVNLEALPEIRHAGPTNHSTGQQKSFRGREQNLPSMEISIPRAGFERGFQHKLLTPEPVMHVSGLVVDCFPRDRTRSIRGACALMKFFHFAWLTLVSFAWSSLQAAPIDFVRQVQPILKEHCYRCHGPDKQKSSLRLDIKSAAMKGGDAYGPGILPGRAAESPLIQFISDPDADMQMPPDVRLSDSEIKVLTDWVNAGAEWPDGVDTSQLVDKLDHWSFRQPEKRIPPVLADDQWSKNEIDRFILDKLIANNFQPAPEASPRDWLRRVTFDLTGLPATPEELQSFLQELQLAKSPDAIYAQAVDHLLDSPHYGERWAQHWLDVVRYADTHGFEVNTERPHAWPYRDYVIQAMNDDTPYDQFIREQIAGDALGKDAATGFLVTASVLLPGQIGKDEPSKRLARQDAIDEIVTNISQTFLALSVGCARCHDHKFDPISHLDYYSMQAFVSGVQYGDRMVETHLDVESKAKIAALQAELADAERRLTAFIPSSHAGAMRSPVNAQSNFDRFPAVTTKRMRFEILETNKLEPCLDELEVFNQLGENVALASTGTTATSSGDTIITGVHDLAHINDGKYGNKSSWMSNETGRGWIELEFPSAQTIERVEWARDRSGRYQDRLATKYRILTADHQGNWTVVADAEDRSKYSSEPENPKDPDLFRGASPRAEKQAMRLFKLRRTIVSQISRLQADQLIFAGQFRKPDDIFLLTRGDPEQPKQKVTPAILSSFSSVRLPEGTTEQARRLALADWIASPENLFTSRVMVNRIWQGHFGTGIVETPSDFGRSGMPPTHPELLDWLGAWFVQSGWSIKQMHRLIVLSATYRQSTKFNAAAALQDADAKFLWRYPLRRHDAETIRDSILACSGRLNLQMGGPGFNLFNQRGGLSGFIPIEKFDEQGHRRMIYAHQVRRERDPVFGAFDRPDGGQSMARRSESTTPLQALNLFNSQFVLDECHAMANRLQREAGSTADQQIQRAWQLAWGRDPDADELADAREIVQQEGLPMLCRIILNSNEFLFMP